jgi:hypothetical protein
MGSQIPILIQTSISTELKNFKSKIHNFINFNNFYDYVAYGAPAYEIKQQLYPSDDQIITVMLQIRHISVQCVLTTLLID